MHEQSVLRDLRFVQPTFHGSPNAAALKFPASKFDDFPHPGYGTTPKSSPTQPDPTADPPPCSNSHLPKSASPAITHSHCSTGSPKMPGSHNQPPAAPTSHGSSDISPWLSMGSACSASADAPKVTSTSCPPPSANASAVAQHRIRIRHAIPRQPNSDRCLTASTSRCSAHSPGSLRNCSMNLSNSPGPATPQNSAACSFAPTTNNCMPDKSASCEDSSDCPPYADPTPLSPSRGEGLG